VDYNSFLTKDFKNNKLGMGQTRRLRLNRLHVILVLVSVIATGVVLSLVSLDAKAKRYAQTLNDDPLKQIVRPLTIPAATKTNEQTDTPAAAVEPQSQWLEVKVKSGDSLAAIFKRNKLDASELHDILQASQDTKQLRYLSPGQAFRIQVDEDNNVLNLFYDINQLETLSVHRDGDAFIASYHHKNVEKRINHASAVINSSLFEAGRAAGLSSQMVMELAHIFGWDVDFALDIREGDSFSVIYEEDFLNGSKLNDGPILAAEFVNQGHAYKAIRYTDASGRSDYYDPNGHSMRKAFLRTPVDFRRISSRFGMRFHPILNRMRMHTGVDYAAPVGTPIKTTGDGKIVFIGRKGGYGKAILIQHGGQYSTLYGHMSRFHRGMSVGKRIKQGQIIGYVGSTGRATGPHLHYEFRVNGVFRNPLTVKLPNAQPINAAYKQDFDTHAQALLSQLTVFNSSLALNH
jgi:murein DD-endopeptidase MepM/ murein hydrolase activator NlpD